MDLCYNEDNKTFFTLLDASLQGLVLETQIQPFRDSQDGRNAWLAIVTANTNSGSQYDDAQKELNLCCTIEWSNQGNILLSTHVNSHRLRHNQILCLSVTNSDIKPPEEYEKCHLLLGSLKYSTAKMSATAQRVKVELENHTCDKFDEVAAELIRDDPVKDKSTKKGVDFNLSSTNFDDPDRKWERKFYPPKEY